MPNKVYVNPESTAELDYTSTGGDVAFAVVGLAAGAGRVSARGDLGAFPKADRVLVRARTKFVTTPVVGEEIGIYFIGADTSTGSTDSDGAFGETDQATTSEDLFRNAKWVGRLMVDQATTAKSMQTQVVVNNWARRYLQIGWWNGTADALTSNPADHHVYVTAIPPEIQ